MDLEYSLGDAQALENRLKARLALHKAGTAEIPGHLGHQARSDLDERLEEIAALLGKELTVLLDEEAEALAFAVAPQKASPYPFSLGIAYVSMGYLRTRYHRARLEHFATAERDPSFDAVIAILRGQENRPPPWETASEALMAFGFRIEGPRQTYAAGQQDLKLVLRNELGREVPVNHLSSGERAMLAIAVAQYIGDSWDSTRAIIA